jgi:hypothetical protein
VNAKAKDSEWVRQRQALEQQQPPDVNEVILMGPDGSLTEGLTSNFFVVSAAGEVVTANEGALNGTVREVVLQVRLWRQCCDRPRSHSATSLHGPQETVCGGSCDDASGILCYNTDTAERGISAGSITCRATPFIVS